MAHIGFGRWLGDPATYTDEKWAAMLDPIDWLHWFIANNIDMTGYMDSYGYIAPAPPPPPPPPPGTDPEGYSDTTARNVLVVYAQHETSLEDPLAPGEYNDTATKQYLSHYKWLGLSKAEWIAAGFDNPLSTIDYPPLAVMAELMFGDSHPFNVIHVGLDTGLDEITSPYIVPASQHPNGYYVGQAAKVDGLDENTHGWIDGDWLGFDNGNARFNQLILDIVASGYLDEQLSDALVYDKNISGKIDFMIIATPQLYKRDYYQNDENRYATLLTLPTETPIAGADIKYIFYQPDGWTSTRVHMHEYFHFAYRDGGHYGRATPEIFADKAWVGGDEPEITLWTQIPDVYCRVHPFPTPPYTGDPCGSCSHRAFVGTPYYAMPGAGATPGFMHPLMAASFGLTTLNRWATTNGNYNIGNATDTWDYLCIQSPYDQTQIMVLGAFYPRTIGGGIDYPYSGNNKQGVYATIIKFLDSDSPPYHYSNFYQCMVQSYIIDTCTYWWSYGDIGTQDYRTYYVTPGATTTNLNPKAVLLDHANPGTNPSGLSLTNNPFGVKVEWIGWTVVSDVQTAQVTITIDSV